MLLKRFFYALPHYFARHARHEVKELFINSLAS